MKYIKTYENSKEEYTFKTGDIVVCNTEKNLLGVGHPIYGQKYEIYEISELPYIKILTSNTFQWWSQTLFVPEYIWDSQQYNL